ncbi:OmpA family protein [Leptotrichia sp. oral taxon 879]|uniref:OmpA family protein n=1 Tax=Leptotrichia sp. oral taxon 879 TaxID=1227267 RepID=UPI0003ADDE05|nr:OmpA family protein [Leptotrichia sp. oral taxon 879]ERK51035.1 OmpA family protein [Leptotrichia sp. oral taxon 879 str. F0557]
MKRPTLVAVSSLVAMAVPTVSEKMTTSDMRKDIIRANVADIQQETVNEVPTLDTPNPQKTAVTTDNPDLITVALTQDGTGTKIVNNRIQATYYNTEKNHVSQSQQKTQAQSVQNVKPVEVVSTQTETTEETTATISEIQESPINNPEKVQISKSEIITLRSNDLNFHKNSTDLKKEAYPVLRDIKDYIEKNDFLVSIIGYTDKSGSSSYNKRLSLRRAEKVSSKLIEIGLSKDRVVDLIGRGENNPIKTNDTEEGRERNRRVEFRFVKKGQV